jgi:hypothetical protein
MRHNQPCAHGEHAGDAKKPRADDATRYVNATAALSLDRADALALLMPFALAIKFATKRLPGAAAGVAQW